MKVPLITRFSVMNASPLSLYRSRYRICSFGSPREFSMYNLGFQNLLNSMDSDCGKKGTKKHYMTLYA